RVVRPAQEPRLDRARSRVHLRIARGHTRRYHGPDARLVEIAMIAKPNSSEMKENVRMPGSHRRSKGAILATALSGAIVLVRAAETPPKPLFPDAAPVCPCESLAKVTLPNTTIDSAALDPSNGWCRVTATVTHPPTGDRVKVFIGLPATNW